MRVGGVICQKDGKVPAAGVVLYMYHTDVKGKYTFAASQVPVEMSIGSTNTNLKGIRN